MFEEMRPWLKIRKLQSARWKIARQYGGIIAGAKKANAPQDEIEAIQADSSRESQAIDDEILQLNNLYLTLRAERRLVPLPEWTTDSLDYERSAITNKIRLARAAQATLKKAIRQEQREAAEQWLMWIPVVSSMTGLLGVVVAVLAIMYKH